VGARDEARERGRIGNWPGLGFNTLPGVCGRPRTATTPYKENNLDAWCSDALQRRKVFIQVALLLVALMKYRSTIRLTVENVSNLPVDFIKVTFDDNTIAPAQQALADGELSVFDTYETEYDLIHRPAFSWDGKESVDIKSGDKATIAVSCLGRVGW
jgi:hypothetical protein